MDDITDEAADTTRVDLVSEIRRLGHAILSRRLRPEQLVRMTSAITTLADDAETGTPVSKQERLERRFQVTHFLERDAWPEPPPDGSPVVFDPTSIVGGELNPFGMGATYHREGEEAVGHVTFGPCFEGPPGRVHGGAVCSLFDEVMGSVFRVTGAPSAFTGELTVRFEAPAPLNTNLEFRARRTGSDRRRQYVEGEGIGPDGRFASATAIFIEMRPEHFAI